MFQRNKFDFLLVIPVVFLLILSVAFITSVFPTKLPDLILFILVSLAIFLIFSFIDLEILLSLSPFLFLLSVFLLISVFLLGNVTRGSFRWIPLGSFTIQPSEFIKPFFALFSSWYWYRNKFSDKNLLVYLLFFFPAFVLIFLQPDLGSTLVLFSIFTGMVLFSGVKLKNLLILVIIFLLALPCFWFFLKDYQKTRVVNYFNPYSDPLGDGYNVIQSTITVGSGGLFGRGFGKGTQSHLSFLPERHTDFIFASAAEEFGFTGTTIILILYMILFLKMLSIANLTEDRQNFLLVLGLLFYLSFQTMVNIGMNIGILPITGITLPFLSYGGSSLLTNMISLGIIENISRKNRREGTLVIR